jgi:transcriptional regulator with XRE-family HTH domain
MKKSLYSPEQESLLLWLKNKRKDTGLNMRDFAAKLDKPHSFVGKVELGERRLDTIEFVKYCNALGIDPHEGIELIQDAIK